jgi:NAD-dependent deacetylase
MRLDNPLFRSEPNDGHRAIVALGESGKLSLLVTQNVDGLHGKAGSDPDKLVEIHGSVDGAMCTSCDWRGEMALVLDRVRAGEEDPPCEVCGGILKSTTILFGENLVADDLQRSIDAARSCDLILAVGTSLGVYPVADLVPSAASSGARVVILNAEPTEMDDLADVVLRGSISAILPRMVADAAGSG